MRPCIHPLPDRQSEIGSLRRRSRASSSSHFRFVVARARELRVARLKHRYQLVGRRALALLCRAFGALRLRYHEGKGLERVQSILDLARRLGPRLGHPAPSTTSPRS